MRLQLRLVFADQIAHAVCRLVDRRVDIARARMHFDVKMDKIHQNGAGKLQLLRIERHCDIDDLISNLFNFCQFFKYVASNRIRHLKMLCHNRDVVTLIVKLRWFFHNYHLKALHYSTLSKVDQAKRKHQIFIARKFYILACWSSQKKGCVRCMNDLRPQLNSFLFSPNVLVQSLFFKRAVDKHQSWKDQLPALIIETGVVWFGEMLPSVLTPKIDAKFSHLIPAALVGAVSIVAKIAVDFFATHLPTLNFARVPTSELAALVHLGFVSSLALRSDSPGEEPITVSIEEALLLLENYYGLKEALKLFQKGPITISEEEEKLFLGEKDVYLKQKLSSFFQVEKKKSPISEGDLSDFVKIESETTQSDWSESSSSDIHAQDPAEPLRQELSSWLSKIDLGEDPIVKPPEKGSKSAMSLQEAFLCWLGQSNFFDSMDAFSKDAQTKANTVAYFAASAIASETLKQAHPILFNTASLLSLAAISAVAMPIISVINRSLFSSAADRPYLKDVLFYANAAAALVAYYVVPKLVARSSLLRLAAVQTVAFIALSTLTTHLLFSKICQDLLAGIERAQKNEEESKKVEKVRAAIQSFKAKDPEFQRFQRVETSIRAIRRDIQKYEKDKQDLDNALVGLAGVIEDNKE